MGLSVQPTIVKPISHTPYYKQLRSQVNAAPTVAQKLAVVQAENGYYAPGFAPGPEARARSVLALDILQTALENAPATWADSDHDQRAPGIVAAQVMHAGLCGAADLNAWPGGADLAAALVTALVTGGSSLVALAAWRAANKTLTGATIAETVKTDMSLAAALQILAAVDGRAAALVAQGAEAAGGAHSTEYGARLRANFADRFKNWVNPFSNPVWGGYVKAAAVVAGLVLLAKVRR